MKTIQRHLVVLSALATLLLAHAEAAPPASETPPSVTDADLKAVSDRIRQTGHQIQTDIREALRKARAQRAALEARQAAERKAEAERARQQALRDAAALAAAKEARQRQALEAAQVQARKDAAERAAKAERERQATLQAQRELEEKLAREQAAKDKASRNGKRKLGEETQFGVDL